MSGIGTCLRFWLRHPQEMQNFFDDENNERWTAISKELGLVGNRACEEAEFLLLECRAAIAEHLGEFAYCRPTSNRRSHRDNWLCYCRVWKKQPGRRADRAPIQVGAALLDERAELVPWIYRRGLKREQPLVDTLELKVSTPRELREDVWEPGTVALDRIPLSFDVSRADLLGQFRDALACLTAKRLEAILALESQGGVS